MEKGNIIKPDRGFVREVIDMGGDSLKRCFQCAACSVTCPLSSDVNPFPRKEMLWAQWGRKDKLLKDADIWLCHQCNDCSVYCPRDAGPGNVLAALRNYSFGHFAVPRMLGKAFREAKYLPLLLSFPIILFLILLVTTGHLSIPEGRIVFAEFIPHIIVDPVFLTLVGIVLIAIAISLSRFWKEISSNPIPAGVSFVDVIKRTALPNLIEFLLHKKFRDCGTSKAKVITHMAIVYGCLGFALVTVAIFIGIYTVGIDLPLALYHPLKIIANLGAIVVFIGCSFVIYRRLKGGKEVGNSSYLDWNLILLILVVVVLGILTEILRLADVATAAYVFYFIHLVSVFYGIAYFPYSKLAHLLYRSLAVLYADYRERFGPVVKADQGLGD